MKILKGKKIVVGITGGIAAYKVPLLVRLLVKSGCDVQVIMTPTAGEYVSDKTLSVLSGSPVMKDFFDAEGRWNNHVKTGHSDLIVVTPATANTIAKMAAGICDNFLFSVYYSARCPVMIFPAMDREMYVHPTLKENIEKLKLHGNLVFPAEEGELASGLTGEGRMPEPATIFRKIRSFFSESGPLKGKKVLVNAGPTYEPIDGVRFIGNYSSGKMGIALADALADAGADVCLVCGPSHIPSQNERVRRIDVQTASEMHQCMLKEFPDALLTVCAAAVADFAPSEIHKEKIKKENIKKWNLELALNPDILSELGRSKKRDQVLVGFALETSSPLENGQKKLKEKNADLILVNQAIQKGKPVFGSDYNECTVLDTTGKTFSYQSLTKEELAEQLTELFIRYLHEK